MFTGIVEELGRVEHFDGVKLRIAANIVLDGARTGDSIAVNGCCLTLVDQGQGWWEADVSAETIARTAFGTCVAGSPVNLERPVRLNDRLGGHLVQGHVDGVGTIVEPAPDLRIMIPHDLTRYVVEKGSIAVDGVSLTVVSIDDNVASAAIIPHTAAVTTLGTKRAGDPVHVEVDVVAKYIERLVVPYGRDA